MLSRYTIPLNRTSKLLVELFLSTNIDFSCLKHILTCPSTLFNFIDDFEILYKIIKAIKLMVFYSKYLPIISFVVGSSALLFQTTVLYPWHNELDNDLKRLKYQKEQQDQKL
jgi:hypothetical protein